MSTKYETIVIAVSTATLIVEMAQLIIMLLS